MSGFRKKLVTLIETNNLVKVLGERYILRGLNLHIKAGESIALLGANGAGKSTWLKIVAGLLKQTEGDVKINGKVYDSDDYERQQLIGFLGHKSFLYESFSPLENLQFFAKLYQMKLPDEQIEQLIANVGLSFFKHEPIHTFSRGMIQRLAIARAILHKPKILLLDEPYTGLDQEAIRMFNDLLRNLHKRGTTIVMITHDFEHIHEVCQRVVMLEKGKITIDEPLAGRTATWVKRLYDGDMVT